jgi:hypothetical protein
MTGVQLEGLVLKNYGGFYYVQDKTLNIHECKIRGKVKERILTETKWSFPVDQRSGNFGKGSAAQE